ncbi:unnamed protein product [Vitrella brassicaformis CCMP3155]|uniref:Armadillo repeat-containing domain-containing protein n=1 Tax=Vitrella brassicaformis (strain CCMP3155) TaxID=1169540 RepID=A0A0G4GGZ9_VITBC|nr:unnamed protein product [Vitrella brassicaformis CCMP3155]|eukprot:CEM28946.1 unnamed protein product [Vitrella brassicaformis CCMP3155]
MGLLLPSGRPHKPHEATIICDRIDSDEGGLFPGSADIPAPLEDTPCCGQMESAASTAEATDGHPSPQAVLTKARDLCDGIHTKEAYDQTVLQRGSEALRPDIASVTTNICHLIASASDAHLRADAIQQLARLLHILQVAVTMGQTAVDEHINGIPERAIAAGVVPVLVEELSGCEEVQLQAATALRILAFHHAAVVASAGAVPPLVQLVPSPNERVCGEAILALCFITHDSATRRDAVLAAGVLQPLLTVMHESDSADALACGAHLVHSMSRIRPLSVPLAEFARFVPVLASLVGDFVGEFEQHEDDRVLMSSRAALAEFAGLCVGGEGDDAARDALVQCGAVAPIKTLLQSADTVEMKGTACMIVYFVTAGSTAHRQAIIDGGLVPVLVDVAASEVTGGQVHAGLKQMAGKAIMNIVADGSQQQMEQVAECGGIFSVPAACSRPTITICSAGEEKQANEGLPDNPYQQLVHQAGGVDKIVTLQAHDDAQIALQAVVVLAHYFPAHADAQVLLAAATLAAFYGSIRN